MFLSLVARFKMAEKADDPCLCTHPELPQFESVSTYKQSASKGKRLALESLVVVAL